MLKHLLTLLFVATLLAGTVQAKGPAYVDPSQVDSDYALQGEYVGASKLGDVELKFGVQVVALGNGKFRAMSYIGGLPGEGGGKERRAMDGELKDGVVVFDDDHGHGELRGGELVISAKKAPLKATLKRTTRQSPTMGQAPPAGAVVLFNGQNADAWTGGKVENGLLVAGCTSKQKFDSFQLHIEFRLPYQPEDSGQARGNSGIYLQGRYEVQMLDSFGLDGKQNECGGIYSVKDPDLNMCLPPLTWQTYDIDYTAAKYEGDKLVTPPRVTVRHNGVKIHDDVALPGDRSTTAAPVAPGRDSGPIYLQDHGNPVRYRNVWIVPK